MKIAFVIRSVAHFSYHESTVKRLCPNGHKVEALCDERWSADESAKAAQDCAAETPGLSLGWSLRRHGLWRKPLLAAREMLSYTTYLKRKDRVEYYVKRWEQYLPSVIRSLMTRSGLARKLLASGPAHLPPRSRPRLRGLGPARAVQLAPGSRPGLPGVATSERLSVRMLRGRRRTVLPSGLSS